MSFKLELNKMKHIKSDAKTTTLQHPAGHTVTIVHAVLSQPNQAALKALSGISKNAETNLQADERKHQEHSKMANGGSVKYSKPELAQKGKKSIEAKHKMSPEQHKSNEEFWTKAEHTFKRPKYDEGGRVPAQQGQHDSPPPNTTETEANKTANVNSPSSMSDAWDRVKNGWAEGGPVNDEPKAPVPTTETEKPKPAPIKNNELDNAGGWHGAIQNLRKELGLAEGGKVQKTPEQQANQRIQNEKDAHNRKRKGIGIDEANFQRQEKKKHARDEFAEEGEARKMYADPDQTVSSDDNTPWTERFGQQLGSSAKDAAGMVLEPVKQVGQAAMNIGEGAANMGKGFIKGADLAPPPEPEEQSQAPQPSQGQPQPQQLYQVGPPSAQQDPSQQSLQQQAGDAYGTQAYSEALKQGIGEQQAGIQQQAAGQMQAAEGKANADIAYTNAIQNQQAIMNQRFTANMKNVNATIKDIDNNHINPNHWQESRTTGNKVAQAIGLMAGGFGAAYTHGGNPAMDYINKQIDRDIAAQQSAQGDRKTVLSAYQQQYQDQNIANLMAKATLQQKYANDIDKAAAQAATPIAAGQMMQASGQLKQASADAIRQATMMHSVLGGAKASGAVTGRPYGPQDEAEYEKLQNYYQYTNPEMAKKRAEAHVAGVGDAPPGTIIPNEVRQQIIAHKSMNDLMNMSLSFSQKPMPNPVTNPQEYAQYRSQASVLQNQLIGQIKQAQHDGVYKPSEAEFLIKQIGGSPGSVFSGLSSVPKIQELQKVKQSEYNHLLETYNLPNQQLPQGGQPQSQQQNQPVIGKDGKSYIRVGNVMRPVK